MNADKQKPFVFWSDSHPSLLVSRSKSPSKAKQAPIGQSVLVETLWLGQSYSASRAAGPCGVSPVRTCRRGCSGRQLFEPHLRTHWKRAEWPFMYDSRFDARLS